MKLTKETLEKIIKEELEAFLAEGIGGIEGLIRFIRDVNADEPTKDEAIASVRGLASQRPMTYDDEWAEGEAKRMSQSNPEDFLTGLINLAHNEMEQ
jgi:hypothetical protein